LFDEVFVSSQGQFSEHVSCYHKLMGLTFPFFEEIDFLPGCHSHCRGTSMLCKLFAKGNHMLISFEERNLL